MSDKANRFVLSYHFTGEMLILFLALYPLFYYNLKNIPFSIYLFILGLALIVFLFLSKITNSVATFMLMAPILFAVSLAFNFGLFFSSVIAVVFVWRFIALYREMYLEGEMTIFQITLVLALIEMMIFKDNIFIIVIVMQLFILAMGFFIANYLQDEKQSKSQMVPFIVKVIASFIGLLALLWAIGSPLLRLVWDYLFLPLWHLATNLFISIFVGLMFLLEKIPLPDIEEQEVNQDNNLQEGNMNNEAFEGASTAEYNEFYAYLIIALLILALLIFIFFKFRKEKFDKKEDLSKSNIATEREQVDKVPRETFGQRFKNRFFNQPKQPVRKLIYRFEHETIKLGQGRKSHETIQEWFARINANIDYHIYEQVRYGEEKVTDQAQKSLKNALENDIQKRKEDLNG